jgi:hypothetical protein
MAVAGAAAVTCVIACSDSTGPDRNAPPTYAAAMEGLTALFTGNPVFQSQRWLAQYFDFYSTVVSAGARPGPGASFVLGGFRALRAQVSRGAMAPSGALDGIPGSLRGRTFVWDPGQGRYLPNASQNGAPEDGVRFRLYAVDTVLQTPSAPLQDAGWTDLRDISTTHNTIVEVVTHSPSQQTAQYQVTKLLSVASGGVNAYGSIESGGRIDLDLLASDVGLAADYVITGSNGYTARLLMNISDASQTATLRWRLVHGADTVAVDLQATATSHGYTGTVKVRGTVVATVTGDLTAPTIVGTGSTPLAGRDLDALQAILADFVTLVVEVDAVFAPVWRAM